MVLLTIFGIKITFTLILGILLLIWSVRLLYLAIKQDNYTYSTGGGLIGMFGVLLIMMNLLK